MIPRRRLYAESSPLEIDFSGRTSSSSSSSSNNNNNTMYSTFTSFNDTCSNQASNNDNTGSNNSNSNSNMPYWLTLLPTILSKYLITSSTSRRWTLLILIGSILLFVFFSGGSNKSGGSSDELFIPGEVWYHNHYKFDAKNKPSRGPNSSNRNLLIVQLSSSRTKSLSDVTSKPNRAYARQWAVDYLLHYSDNTICQSQLLWDIYQRRTDDGTKDEPIYDAVLFLSSDAVITDLDYDLLTLLPEHNLLTVTSNNEKLLSLWNLRHKQFKKVARLWRDIANCDTSILELVEEEFMTTSRIQDTNDIVTTLSPSAAGFVEPRLVKFLLDPNSATVSSKTVKLQATADSVCYRYYPRCDVL